MSDYKPIEKLDYTFYKWIHTSKDLIDLCYVGSTANMVSRKALHKSCCNNPNSKEHNILLYKTMRENGGFNNFKMVILGTTEQITKREAQAIEEQYRVAEKATLNERRCYITDEQKKEHKKQYRQEHKDELAERQKQYYKKHEEEYAEYRQEHKDELAEKRKQYYKDNKQELIEKAKKYYQENKANMLEKQNQYDQEHKEQKAERRKQYNQDHKAEVKEKRKQYRQAKKALQTQAEEVI